MRGNWLYVGTIWVLSLPCLGVTALDRGEQIAAWVSVLAMLISGVLWAGVQYRSWRKQIVEDAISREKQAERQEQISKRLEDGAKEFQRIFDVLEVYAKGRRADRRAIKSLRVRMDEFDTNCRKRHEEAA